MNKTDILKWLIDYLLSVNSLSIDSIWQTIEVMIKFYESNKTKKIDESITEDRLDVVLADTKFTLEDNN